VLPAGVLAGVIGEALVATVELRPTRLAGLAWEAVQRGWFTGCCAEVRGGHVTRVILGDIENSCLPNARVIKALEGDDAA
jgi:hypothetical protein